MIKRSRFQNFKSMYGITFYVMLFLLLMLTPRFASAQLEVTKQVDSATVLSGSNFTYTLKYRCASTLTNCMDVVMIDTIPTGLKIISTTGTIHTVNDGTLSGNIVKFVFKNPLPAGATGDLKIVVAYPNGSTPNNTSLSNRAWITDGLTQTPSNIVTNTAVAFNRVTPIKTLLGGGAIGAPTTYQITVCPTSYNEYFTPFGTLNPMDLTITDQLPAGATLLSISDGGTVNGSGLITWTIPNGQVGVTSHNTSNCINRTVTVQYDSPAFNVGDVVINNAQTVHTPLGTTTPVTTVNGDIVLGKLVDLRETTSLVLPSYAATIVKTSSKTALYAGQSSNYALQWSNMSNVPLNNFSVEDSIPDEIRIDHFNVGNWAVVDYSTYKIYYKTNLNATYTLWPGFPYFNYINLTTNSLGLATGEYVNKIKFDFGSFPAGATMVAGTAIYMSFTAKEVVSNTLTTNKITLATTSPLTGTTTATADVTVIPRPNFSIPQPRKVFYSAPSSSSYLYNAPKSVGDTAWVGLDMTVNGGGQPITNPTLVDLLPLGLTYDGAWQRGGDFLGLGAPIFTLTPNYNNTGRELVTFKWTGTPAIQDVAQVFFRVKVNNKANPPYIDNYAGLYGSNSTGCIDPNIYAADDGFLLDVNDLNQNGSQLDSICLVKATIYINPSAALESGKSVKGLLDTAYSKYPEVGSTVPGSNADYKLFVRNVGNVPIKNLEVIDILPFIGDRGVVDSLPRLTQWRPNLAGPITAPAGVTVYYSQSGNPCRPNLVPSGPVGCELPNWSATLPSDITTVQSVRFDFGTIVLQGNEQYDFAWPMRAPFSAPTNGEIAWNSLGFTGTRTDNNNTLLAAEPLKVGIKVLAEVPAAYGNYVWLDTNQNGIQDETNTGINGVRIELYRDNGDGLNNPANDTLVNFTVTGNGGFYKFTNLPTGNYYAVVYPPTGFTIATPNNPSDATDLQDSDGTSGIFNGVPVAIFPITQLSPAEIDFSWDLGLYCSEPTFQATANVSTCSGINPNNNGYLTITNVVNADRFAVSSGLIFSGTAYELATPITNFTAQTVLNNLPPSATPRTFVIRLYNGQTGCFHDKTVVVPAFICPTCPSMICLPVTVIKH